MPPSGIRRFFDIVATMADVISLGVGEPDFDTPRVIVEAGVESLREGRTHYTSNSARSSCAARCRATSSALYGVALRPGDRDPDHGRRVGGGRPARCAATCDPGDEVILHEPSYVAYVPAIVFAGGVVAPRRDPLRGRLRARPGGGRGGDHAADQGAVPGLPVQPDRRGPAGRGRRTRWPTIAVRHDLLVYSDEIYDRLAYGTLPPPGDERAAGHARADDPDGRLLEGVRDDRLAGRLRGGAGGDPRGHRQGPPVRDHVGADDRPGRGAGRASSRARPTSSGWSPSTTAAGGCSSTGSTPSGLETFEPRGAFYAFPRIGSTGLTDDEFTERLLIEEHVAVVPGSAFGPSGEGHVRMCYATSYERLEEALGRIGRFVERARA